MTKELQKALIRTIWFERDRISNEIYKEKKRIRDLAAGPMAAFEIDVKKLSSLYEEQDYCLSLLSVLSDYYRPQKQRHLGKKAPFIVRDDYPLTTPAPAVPRPTDKDIERIRYELDRAIAIADNVDDHISLIRRYPHLGPFPELFFAEIAALLRSVSNARTEFNAAYPEEVRK